MKTLRRFWFEFERTLAHTPFGLGCGFTAFDREDALAILRERVGACEDIGKVVRCEEDVDVSTLDEKHVLPNMGSVLVRGVWFPLGF
jgi:hypothetical protein